MKPRTTKGIVAWGRANAGSMMGIDTASPLLPQFDLPADGQVRGVMCSLDPLADG